MGEINCMLCGKAIDHFLIAESPFAHQATREGQIGWCEMVFSHNSPEESLDAVVCRFCVPDEVVEQAFREVLGIEKPCVYCAEPGDTRDHIIPRSRGGSDDPENLVACCRSCNSKKGARTPEEAGMVIRR